VTFVLVAIALVRLVTRFRGAVRLAIAAAAFGSFGYVIFMGTLDVPMYFARWQADLASGKRSLSALAGIHDVATRWIVTHDIAEWRDEIAWMSLYFSLAVWTSLVLGGFGLVRTYCRATSRVCGCEFGPTATARPHPFFVTTRTRAGADGRT
jgi:hypothetical protein